MICLVQKVKLWLEIAEMLNLTNADVLILSDRFLKNGILDHTWNLAKLSSLAGSIIFSSQFVHRLSLLLFVSKLNLDWCLH